jgi:Fe-S cluster assembly protein SufD
MSELDPETRFTRTALERAESLAGPDAGVLGALRAAGRDAFARAELPGRKTEAWKYSRTGPLLEEGLLDRPDPAANAVAAPAFEGLACDRILLVDGVPRDLPADPDGVTIRPFSALPADGTAPAPGALAAAGSSPFVALNAALAEDGILVHVRRDAAPERILELVLAQGDGAAPRGAHPRVLLVLEPGARLTLLERQIGAGTVFTNTVVEAHVGAGASLSHLRLGLDAGEGRWLTTLEARLDRDARYGLHLAQVGSRFRRNELRIHLAGAGAEARVGGATLTRDRTHLDTQLALEHEAPHCTSEERFRAIAGERSRTVLNGRIHIHPGAQKTDAQLDTRNLLLSPHAEIDAKPELEIYADDVKCAHGATVGRLDPTELFYLRSRGVDEVTARTMLSFAFLGSVVDAFPVPEVAAGVRAELERAFAAPAQEANS